LVLEVYTKPCCQDNSIFIHTGPIQPLLYMKFGLNFADFLKKKKKKSISYIKRVVQILSHSSNTRKL